MTIYYPAVTAIFIVVDRYRWPLEDVLSLLAGLGAAVVFSSFKGRRGAAAGSRPLLARDDGSTARTAAG